MKKLFYFFATILVSSVMGQENAPALNPPPASAETNHVASLTLADLSDFESQSPEVKTLLAKALQLTSLNLKYLYGSCDPAQGGMDCSGTVYYLLNSLGLKDVPRDSSGLYQWVWTQSQFHAVTSSNPKTFELSLLKPGDLLFWTGTYAVKRDPPITHVMIYLGINRQNGLPVMFGASEGRRFNGKSEYGVSVFDFSLSGKKSEPVAGSADEASPAPQPQFIGYGSIPGLKPVSSTR